MTGDEALRALDKQLGVLAEIAPNEQWAMIVAIRDAVRAALNAGPQEAHKVSQTNTLAKPIGYDATMERLTDMFEMVRVEEISRLRAIEGAAKRVCDYDWSDNDDDAVDVIADLRIVLRAMPQDPQGGVR